MSPGWSPNQGSHHLDPKPSHWMGGEVQRHVMRNCRSGVTSQGQERCASWWRFGGAVHVERAAKAGLRGEGSTVTRLARVLPAAPARPPAPRAHASRCIQAAPTSVWEGVWQDILQDKGSGCLDGHLEP